MNIIRNLSFSLVLVASAAMAEVTDTKEYNFSLQEGGRISLSNVNGDVQIDGVAGDQVHIVATRRAASQKSLDGLEVVIDASDSDIRIETRHPNNESRWLNWNSDSSGSVDYVLTVPAGAQLDSIETVNGVVVITGVTGSVSAESVNGKLTLEGLEGDVKLDTVNGSIDAQFNVLGAGQRVSADAVNGRIVLRFPDNASAQVHAETLNGGIDADDFSLEPQKGYVGRDLDGEIGDGEARVDIDTVNGSVTIKRSK